MRRSLLLALLALLAAPQFAHAAGDRILFLSNRDGTRELYLVDRDGTGLERLTFNDISESQPVWSPDRSRIAFSGARSGLRNIYTVAADGGDLQRVTDGAARDGTPRWTSDGQIVFVRSTIACQCFRPWIVNADGSEASELPLPGNVITLEPSPHGQRVVYATDVDGPWSLHVAQLNGRGDQKITDGAVWGDFAASWSPQGNELAFLRDVTGHDNDVYVVHANGRGLRRLTDTPGRIEFSPTWSSDGSEVLFDTDARELRAISLVDGHESVLSTVPRAPFLEAFGDGRRESSFWHQLSDPGSSIGEVDGRLVISISGDAIPGGQFNQVAAHWGSNCRLAGDFDYQVDYELLVWPQHGGFFASMNAFFADAAVARSSDPWDPPFDEQYNAWRGGSDFAFNVIQTLDLSGSMRLVRVDGTIFAYKRSPGGDWDMIFSAPGVTGEGVIGIGLSTPADRFAHRDGSVAYDNFRLNSGELSCPSWWADMSPDVY